MSHVIFEDAHAGRFDALVRKDPGFADIARAAKAILDVDFATLRKVRDDDASGALKKFLGDGEDPREWKQHYGKASVTVADGRVTELNLFKCSSLAALPGAIGELKALTKLDLYDCSSLAALPAAIGELKALTELDLGGCSSLVALLESISGLDALTELDLNGCTILAFPPPQTHGDVGRVKRLLANTTRLLAGEVSAADADDDAKIDFSEGPIHHAQFADRLEDAVRKDPALADLTNKKGERAIELACLECRRAMQKALFFLGRYEIADGAPEHRSATSIVVRALDYEAAEDYGRLFDEADTDSSETLEGDELKALAAKLGTNVKALGVGDEKLTKTEVVDKLRRRFGKERKVVIKIFQVEEQWCNEKAARDDQQLDAQFVVQTIPAPEVVEADDGSFKQALDAYGKFKEKRFGGNVGTRAIVMDAADRNLFQIYQSERPDLNKVRVLMRETMECVQHLHETGLVHGDIKMLNVVRLIDNRLRLIDLDAAAKFSENDAKSYVGSKFSSAVLPPECFAKLDANEVKQFNAYFQDGDDVELREKVAPKVDKRGASYAVKTFSLTDEGTPKQTEGLPYELVEASEAIDYWSLGALLFQLVAGEPLVPSNRDDDCVDGNAMATLASWEDRHRKRRLDKVAEKDAAAWDLAS